jgi:hypothetical protein
VAGPSVGLFYIIFYDQKPSRDTLGYYYVCLVDIEGMIFPDTESREEEA